MGINGSRERGGVDVVVEEIRAAGGTASGVMADVSDPDALAARMVDAVHDELGPIDIAASNVGVRKAAPLPRTPGRASSPRTWR
ncbi:hypothetical protein [Micromonospora globispora]|uniref:hypothetical protein n=1 Tax=Micromonospora globispora TaxID=1450148 RepID=UPI001401F524